MKKEKSPRSVILKFLYLLYSAPFTLCPFFVMADLLYTPSYRTEDALEVPSSREIATDLLWKAWKNISKADRGKSGVVLSGGGARAIAHVGVLHHLEEIGFPIDVITGTSMGAVVGGLYAAGVPILSIERMAQDTGFEKLPRFNKWTFLKLGLNDGLASVEAWQKWLRKSLGQKTFADLKIPFIACATDLASGELVLLREGDLATALLAAGTIPGLFAPVSIRQYYLVDGGIFLNVPTGAAYLLGADNTFLSDVSARGHAEVFTRTPSAIAALYRIIEVQGNRLESRDFNQGDFRLRFYPSGIDIFELWRWREAYEAGLMAARQNSLEMRLAFISKAIKKMGPTFFVKSAAGKAQVKGAIFHAGQ